MNAWTTDATRRISRLTSTALLVVLATGCLLTEDPHVDAVNDDVILLEPGNSWPRLDEFAVEKVEVTGDSLRLRVAYSGGCSEHGFQFFSTGPVIKTLPPGADFWIRHDANGDQCEAYIRQDLAINIKSLRADETDTVQIHVLDFNLDGYTTVPYVY